ncbi:MAG: hypothetical protein COA33_006735 [Fluviicola sp.]|nr:hypothetical protein [Fluviicola sp.]
MGTAELKTHLHQLIDGITDNSVLKEVYTLLSKSVVSDEDWWNDLSKKSIEKGLNQANKGEFTSHEKVMSEVKGTLHRY